MTHLSARELSVLRRLRHRFLKGAPGQGDYWREADELEIYDRTFGERIGWKWDAVLGELELRGWKPQSRRVIDWGCGSGIAGRRLLEKYPGQFHSLALHDRSSLAVRYAANRVQTTFPEVAVVTGAAPEAVGDTLLVVSHVLNELLPEELAKLLSLARQAREVIWVEAGTHAESRRLGAEVREPLRASGFAAVAPCTHNARCGMLTPDNERHWCHSFGRPPSTAFQDSRWTAVGKELEIDLRALPYSFIVLEKAAGERDTAESRVIGHPREYKGYEKVLSCQAEGVCELMLQKRDAPELWREVRNPDGAPIYRWEREGGRIVGGEASLKGE